MADRTIRIHGIEKPIQLECAAFWIGKYMEFEIPRMRLENITFEGRYGITEYNVAISHDEKEIVAVYSEVGNG